MLFRILLFICFPALVLTAAQTDNTAEGFSIAPTPEWVRRYDFALEPVQKKSAQDSVQYLLVDTQKNWKEQAFYVHFALRVLTQSGVQEISQLAIPFEPPFQRLALHGIRVFREGDWSDRMENSEHHLIQREEGLDHGIFTGNQSMIYMLDDIRVGDIIEYAYSIVGENPLFSSHYADLFHLQHGKSIGKLSFRLVSSPDHLFQIQPFHTSIQPQITDLSSTLREWYWEAHQTPVYEYESDCPAWHYPRARVQISQYQTWQEVVEKVGPLFDLPEDLAYNCPEEMLDLVNTWKAATNSPEARALLALRFVQDEVRYLGLEMGVNGYKPHDPRAVFQKRFGDCKDKTQLLRALLYLMDITSSPLLVSMDGGKLIFDEVPSPYAFDHAVIQIEINGSISYADTTLGHQGGSLYTNYFPDYYAGLLLSETQPGLIALPEYQAERPTEIETHFSAYSADAVTLTTKRTYYGHRADAARNIIDHKGLEQIAKSRLNDLQERYGDATELSPLEILDNRDHNILTVTGSYTIPTHEREEGKTLEIISATFEDYLETGINPTRRSPFALSYPLWIKEHIHVDNKIARWDDNDDETACEHESIFFKHNMRIKGQNADFYYELKHLQDHIPKHALYDYWKLSKEIERCIFYELAITP